MLRGESLRHEHPNFPASKIIFKEARFEVLKSKTLCGSTPGGTEMEDEEWNTAFVRTLGVMLSGGYD
jgi:hypothetical protein